MNITELKKRISEVLGVSLTQSEIAYDIFLDLLLQSLSYGLTLKIPRIGFFQLKNNQESTSTNQILFASLPEDYSLTSKNFYLTLEFKNKTKNNYEVDSQIFSIGVGKPLLPLSEENYDHEPEISFEMLKKSIEERVKELLSESDQIPNYNIWEEFIYYDKDENLFEMNNLSENNLETSEFNKNVNLIDKLLSQTDFTIENDFHEDELLTENLNQKIDEEINSIDFDIPKDLSIDSMLEEINIIEKEDQPNNENNTLKINENITEYDDSLNKLNEITTFADELKNQIKELEKIGNEIIKEDREKAIIENEELQNDNVEDLSSLIQIEENQIENYDQVDAIDGNFTQDEIKNESEEGIILSSLLDEDVKKNEENIIDIEPPASAKELIIDDYSMFNNDIINIEENELKEIVQNEITNIEQNYKEENNSDVLNKLLTEEQIKKIEIKDEITEDETEITSVEETSTNKIEWNWGDELKEEFGIGRLESIESENKENDKNEFELHNELNENYENNLPQHYEDSPTIELRKTRVDLFTKLEETLEREINFLKQEIELSNEEIVFEKPEVADKVKEDKNDVEEVEDNSTKKIDFKDEKVILDFKTPPPHYEFIEEKPIEKNTVNKLESEPLLKPPKKITIILSPEEQENLIEKKTITKTLENSETEVEIVQQVKEKKNYWKVITIILSIVMVLITSIYFVLNNINKKTNIVDSQINVAQKNYTENKNQNIQQQVSNFSNSNNELTVDEYSDFPISATPPKPIKSGNEINVQQLIPQTKKIETKTITPTEIRNDKSKIDLNKNQAKEQKVQLENKNVAKVNSQNEIRLGNMIFYDGKNYSFQISSWKNKSLAEIEVNRLRSLGFNAFLTEAYLPQKGGMWYRIRIGYFNSEQEAIEFMKKNNF